MRDADLTLPMRRAVRQAAAGAAPDGSTETCAPVTEAPQEPEPDGDSSQEAVSEHTPGPSTPQFQPRSWRGRLFGWLYPGVDYLRRFSLAPVTARLDDWRADATGRSAETLSRLDRVETALDRIERALVLRGEELARLADRLGETREQLHGAQKQTAAEVSALWGGLREVAGGLRDVAIRQDGHSAALDRLAGEAVVTREGVGALLSVVGPRFDELEIKIRPLIEFDEESYAVRLADGYAMTPRSEPALTLMVVNAPSGGLEAGTRRVLQALIRPGMRVADVGANIGLLTLACARATGPEGRVYAFEPERGPRRQLEKTAWLNGLSWVEVSPYAAGARRATAEFHVSPIIGHSSLYALPSGEAEGSRVEKVEVARLDTMIAPEAPLDVVKIDVEGAELDVLAGLEGHLAASPDIALVAEFGPSHLARVGVTPKAWWEAFTRHGFRVFGISEPDGVCRPIRLSEALRHDSINLAFVRPGGNAIRRLPRA